MLQVSGSHGSSELMMLLSLRLFPVSPNWLLNIASPHVGVKLYKFALSVLLGMRLLHNHVTTIFHQVLLHTTSYVYKLALSYQKSLISMALWMLEHLQC